MRLVMESPAITANPDAATPPVWDYHEAFSRNIGLFTVEEQEKLRRSRVAIAGMGGAATARLLTKSATWP
jgi:tRNA A37 threonylcarbamoyladenosine dehydratase